MDRTRVDRIIEAITVPVTASSAAVLTGVALTLHDALDADRESEAALYAALQGVIAKESKGAPGAGAAAEQLVRFLAQWVRVGRPLAVELLREMEAFVKQLAPSASRTEALEVIDRNINGFSPVLGRWRADFEPRTDVFVWLRWEPRAIAAALTSMCLPFYALRPYEFNEKNPGKHLKDLNLRYNSVSKFVTASVLLAAVVSKRSGLAAMEKWLSTASELHAMRNYHMLFALQNAFQKHQLDRLSFLRKKISKSAKQMLKVIDALFNTSDRMKRFKAELDAAVGKEPTIPCVFWLVQKATLLQETPVLLPNKSFNPQRFTAAGNIFGDLYKMQATRYPPLHEQEQVVWYLMRLERDDLCSEDELYKLSDAAKKNANRIQLSSSADVTKKRGSKTFVGRKMSMPGSSASKKERKASDTSISGSPQDSGNTSQSQENSSEPHDDDIDELTDTQTLESILKMADLAVSGKADSNFLGNVAGML